MVGVPEGAEPEYGAAEQGKANREESGDGDAAGGVVEEGYGADHAETVPWELASCCRGGGGDALVGRCRAGWG